MPQTFEPSIGSSISDAAVRMVAIAVDTDDIVTADFNGITLTASATTVPDEVVTYYTEESKRRHDAYLASPEYAAKMVEAEKAARKAEADAAELLARAPATMTLRDTDGWDKSVAANQDGYGAGVMRYAERWARMMEAEIAAGKTLKECANSTSHTAETEGITGFMHSCAISILSQVWIHGEGLRAAIR